MKLRLTAAVEGTLELRSPSVLISAARPPFTFGLKSDATKRVAEASVTLSMAPEDSLRCRCLSTEGSRLDIIVPPHLYEVTLQQLQLLESDLSFGFLSAAVTRIRWDEPTIDLLPENKPEEDRVNTWGFHVQRKYTELRPLFSEHELREMVTNAPKYQSLVVAKAFYREGANEFRALRYVHAFNSFYFVIEGMFADGRFREREVLRAYRDSAEMTTAIEITLSVLGKDPEQSARLDGALVAARCRVDADGLRRFLVLTRGRLHHFFSKSSVRHGTPFSNSDFETPALIAKILARQCIMVRIVTINNGSAT